MEAASIRKDLVTERLKSLDMHKPFYYHMSNACYKMYTMKKTLGKLKGGTTRNISLFIEPRRVWHNAR